MWAYICSILLLEAKIQFYLNYEWVIYFVPPCIFVIDFSANLFEISFHLGFTGIILSKLSILFKKNKIKEGIENNVRI